MLGSCYPNDAVDALAAKVEQEKKIAEERREQDDLTAVATDPPVDIKFGSELK